MATALVDYQKQLTFPIFRNFLPNHGRILPALTHNGSQPLNVNAGRILPGFGRKLGNIEKHESLSPFGLKHIIFDNQQGLGY